MKSFGKNKIGFILLIFTVVVIWGIILLRVIDHFSDNNEVQIDVPAKSVIAHHANHYNSVDCSSGGSWY